MKKVLIGILVVIVLLIGALVAIPFLFKDKLVAIAKKEINDNINAKVDFNDFGVTIFKDFPNISLYLKNVSVVNQAPFLGDTLAQIGEVAVSADIMSVIKGGQISINSIGIDKPIIHVKVLKDGSANYNITKPDSVKKPEPAESKSYAIKLKKFTITGGYITYDDRAGNMYASINNLDNTFSGDFTQDNFTLKTNTTTDSVTVISGAVPYLNKVKTALKIEMDIDQKNSKYTFKDNNIQLNELSLGLDGFVQMVSQSGINMDLKFKAKETEFKNIISLVPAIYTKDFKDVKTSGSLGLDGYAKGTYRGVEYPAFGVNLKVDNASFQYPSLPAAVTNINIALKAISPGGGLDNAVVDISKFTLKLANDPFSMTLHAAHLISDPDLNATLIGKVDLGGVKNYYPLKGDELSGLLNLNVTAAGRLSSIEKKDYQHFNAAGTVEVSNMNYTSKDLPKAVKVNDLKLVFSPQYVELEKLSAQIGKSDFNATGRIDNLLNYVFSKAMLKGTFSLKSNVIDLNEFMTPESKTTATTQKTPAATTTTVQSTAVMVPENINFTMDATIGKLIYTNMELNSLTGKITVADETVTLNSLKANTLDGTIALSGSYSTKTDIPLIDMTIGLNKISIPKAATTFETSQKIVPIVNQMKGTFSTNFVVKGKLDKNMSPDLNTLLADGRVDIDNLEFSGNKVLNTLADKFNQSQLKNVKVPKFWTAIKVVNGKIFVSPFDVVIDKVKMNIYGSHSLTNQMDYTILMDAPSEWVGKGTALVSDLLAKSPIPGVNASALPKELKFKIGLTGALTDPKVNVGLVSAGSGSVKDDIKQKLDDEKKKLEQQANAAKQQAEDKARAELAKQQAAAQQKAQQAADKAKQQAEQKAKDAIKGFKLP